MAEIDRIFWASCTLKIRTLEALVSSLSEHGFSRQGLNGFNESLQKINVGVVPQLGRACVFRNIQSFVHKINQQGILAKPK